MFLNVRCLNLQRNHFFFHFAYYKVLYNITRVTNFSSPNVRANNNCPFRLYAMKPQTNVEYEFPTRDTD